MTKISPIGDLAFKKALASEDSKDVLSGFISDFLDITVAPEAITLENPYNIEVYKQLLKGEETSALRHTESDIAASLKFADFVSELQVHKI